MLNKINRDYVEGKDFINVSSYSKHKIGKMLAPGYPVSFKTVLGTTGSIRNAINFMTIKDYPIKLIGKKRLTSYDVKSIQSKESIKIDNYKAHLTYFIATRIKDDSVLVNRMKKLPNDIIFTSFNINTDSVLNIKSILYNDNQIMYCDIIESLFKLIKSDMFTNEHINKLVIKNKNSTNELFNNLANPISIL